MKFLYTPLLDKNYYPDESPEMESMRVWRHRRSVKVFASRQHHQDTLRCYESMPRGMYSFNHKLADMDRDRHNRIAWHKYGNFVVEKERFPTLPNPLFPDRCACMPEIQSMVYWIRSSEQYLLVKHTTKKQTRGAQAIRRKRTLFSRTFKRRGAEEVRRNGSNSTSGLLPAKEHESGRLSNSLEAMTEDSMRNGTRSCQQRSSRNSIEMDAEIEGGQNSESEWVDIEDEELFESLVVELDLDEDYIWL